jgi:ATPase subunit of ABC transporter with duplicated ATPase domains
MSDVNNESSSGDGNFSEFIARARERLHTEREQVFGQQEELQHRLAAINREFAAIEAYETAKTGKAARQASAGRQPRARRGSRREALLELIRQSDGLSRGEILERMGLKGDKSGEMSVSNALTALTKSNHVRREGGKYRAAT